MSVTLVECFHVVILKSPLNYKLNLKGRKYSIYKWGTVTWVLWGVYLGGRAAAAGALSLLSPGGAGLPLHPLTGGLPALLTVSRSCFTAHRWHAAKKYENKISSQRSTMLKKKHKLGVNMANLTNLEPSGCTWKEITSMFTLPVLY